MRMRVLVALALTACSAPLSSDGRTHRGSATFVLARSAGASAVPRPFVSIVDSVQLYVTGSDGVELQFGRRLARRDTSVTFPLELPAGEASFYVEVVSTTAKVRTGQVDVVTPMTLFDQEHSADIQGDDFVVRLAVVAHAPVLLATPDTLQLALPFPSSTIGEAVFTLHNRGVDSLHYAIADSTRNSVSQCGTTPCLDVRRESGALGAVPPGGTVVWRVRGLRQSSSPITLWIVSPQGDVPLVVRPLAAGPAA